MGRHEKKPSKKKVKIEWSKLVSSTPIGGVAQT